MSSLMPAIHPEAAGISGSMHGADFKVADPVQLRQPGKAPCCLTHELLHDDAALGRKIVREFKPEFEARKRISRRSTAWHSPAEPLSIWITAMSACTIKITEQGRRTYGTVL
ncbi:MAG: hypothetical protein ACLU3I_17095 [Acutalibacteraceae bacterium]